METPIILQNTITSFLKGNGFTQVGDDYFENKKCEVYILTTKIMVWDREKDMEFNIPDKNLFWLIGVLTYNWLMDKDYKQTLN